MSRKIPVQSYYDPITKTISHQTIISSSTNPEVAAYSNIMGAKQPELLVEIMKDEDGENVGIVPTRGHPTDAGLDIYAAEDSYLAPIDGAICEGRRERLDTHRVTIGTGIKVQIPPGMCLLLWDRSGLSAKHGLHRVAGVIDSSYRGEIKIALVNLSHISHHIKRGDRIAQAILSPMILPSVKVVGSLSSSGRGEGGFGSTGR